MPIRTTPIKIKVTGPERVISSFLSINKNAAINVGGKIDFNTGLIKVFTYDKFYKNYTSINMSKSHLWSVKRA
jgi:hypothetical protein